MEYSKDRRFRHEGRSEKVPFNQHRYSRKLRLYELCLFERNWKVQSNEFLPILSIYLCVNSYCQDEESRVVGSWMVSIARTATI